MACRRLPVTPNSSTRQYAFVSSTTRCVEYESTLLWRVSFLSRRLVVEYHLISLATTVALRAYKTLCMISSLGNYTICILGVLRVANLARATTKTLCLDDFRDDLVAHGVVHFLPSLALGGGKLRTQLLFQGPDQTLSQKGKQTGTDFHLGVPFSHLRENLFDQFHVGSQHLGNAVKETDDTVGVTFHHGIVFVELFGMGLDFYKSAYA